MNNNRFFGNKCLLLAVILIAMFSMSGCRTRITNNSEVSNVYYDEDGFLTETYQMRRDELGLSTAERPILPNLGGSSENDRDDFDTSEDSTLNYQPEEDNYVEPPATNTTTNTTTNTNTTTTTNRSTTPTTTPTTPSRSSRSSTNSNNESISITFKPGKEGKITGLEKGKSLTKTVPKNSSIQVLASDDVDRSGYTLTGWKDSDGNEVKPGKSLKATKKTTYTAQWKKKETQERKTKPSTPTPTPDPTPTPVEKFKVTFVDGQGNTLSEQEIEKGKAATAPKDPTRDGYDFKGWDVDFNNVTQPLTVTAQWEATTKTIWQDSFEADCNNVKETPIFIMADGSDSAYIQDCKARTPKESEDYEYVIAFADVTEIKNTLKNLAEETNDGETESKYKGKKIIVIADKGKKDKNILAYKIKLMTILHSDSRLDPDKAAKELIDDDVHIETKLSWE